MFRGVRNLCSSDYGGDEITQTLFPHSVSHFVEWGQSATLGHEGGRSLNLQYTNKSLLVLRSQPQDPRVGIMTI